MNSHSLRRHAGQKKSVVGRRLRPHTTFFSFCLLSSCVVAQPKTFELPVLPVLSDGGVMVNNFSYPGVKAYRTRTPLFFCLLVQRGWSLLTSCKRLA